MPVIAAAVVPPIGVPSIAPPSTSTVLAASTLNGNVRNVEPSYTLITWFPAPPEVSIQIKPSVRPVAGAVALVCTALTTWSTDGNDC